MSSEEDGLSIRRFQDSFENPADSLSWGVSDVDTLTLVPNPCPCPIPALDTPHRVQPIFDFLVPRLPFESPSLS